VLAPNFEGALSFFTRAADIFSQTYDGKDEVRRRMGLLIGRLLVGRH
jgi:hypothetical protein